MPAKDSLIKEGGDLLSHRRSTIGAGGLNFSVRNGKRWGPAAIATRMGRQDGKKGGRGDPDRGTREHTPRRKGFGPLVRLG